MSNHDRYIMLMASLPHPGPLFSERQPPLSRLRLDRRLRQLDAADARVLAAVEGALEWRLLGPDVTDEVVLARVRNALAVTRSRTLRGLIDYRMEVRTCLAALRRRAAGEGPPPAHAAWGSGRWCRRIAQNWHAPAFGLERLFPWLRDADRLLASGDAYELERLILEIVYSDLARRGGLHRFDIEAVVIYVLKWSLVERWSRYNAEAASRRFAKLLQSSLDTAPLLAGGAARNVTGGNT